MQLENDSSIGIFLGKTCHMPKSPFCPGPFRAHFTQLHSAAGIVHEVAISLLLLKIDKHATDMRHFFIKFYQLYSCLFQSFDLYLSETKQLQYLQILLTYTSPPRRLSRRIWDTPNDMLFREFEVYHFLSCAYWSFDVGYPFTNPPGKRVSRTKLRYTGKRQSSFFRHPHLNSNISYISNHIKAKKLIIQVDNKSWSNGKTSRAPRSFVSGLLVLRADVHHLRNVLADRQRRARGASGALCRLWKPGAEPLGPGACTTVVSSHLVGWLVGQGHPSEKYDFVNWDDDFSQYFYGKIKLMATIHHQPAIFWQLQLLGLNQSTSNSIDLPIFWVSIPLPSQHEIELVPIPPGCRAGAIIWPWTTLAWALSHRYRNPQRMSIIPSPNIERPQRNHSGCRKFALHWDHVSRTGCFFFFRNGGWDGVYTFTCPFDITYRKAWMLAHT